MLELVAPDITRRDAWLESHHEWGEGPHEDGFGIRPEDEVETPEGFAAWVDWLRSRRGHLWWIVDGDVVLGGITLRPFDTDWTRQAGHIGYGVRPSARGRCRSHPPMDAQANSTSQNTASRTRICAIWDPCADLADDTSCLDSPAD